MGGAQVQVQTHTGWHTSSMLSVPLKDEFMGRISFSSLLPPCGYEYSGSAMCEPEHCTSTCHHTTHNTQHTNTHFIQYLMTAMFTGAQQVTCLKTRDSAICISGLLRVVGCCGVCCGRMCVKKKWFEFCLCATIKSKLYPRQAHTPTSSTSSSTSNDRMAEAHEFADFLEVVTETRDDKSRLRILKAW